MAFLYNYLAASRLEMLAVALLLPTLIPPPPRLDDILSHGRAVETVEEVDVLRHRW
jgi:hypothetical protein